MKTTNEDIEIVSLQKTNYTYLVMKIILIPLLNFLKKKKCLIVCY